MRTSTLLPIGLVALTSALPTSNLVPRQANTTACATGVHMIVARASTEQPGQGIIGSVATHVQQAVPGSDSEAVDYPATLTDYLTSEASGVAAMTKLIQDYSTRCPSSKIALMGYSQGAQVVGDTMCGTSEANFNSTPPLPAEFSKNVIAIIQMGDPTHVPNLPQDVGNSTKAGIFPRINTASCASMAPITRSFCNADDRFCDSGTSIPVHLAYVQGFGAQAKDFVVQRVMGGAINGTSTVNGTNVAGNGTVKTSDAAYIGGKRVMPFYYFGLLVLAVTRL